MRCSHPGTAAIAAAVLLLFAPVGAMAQVTHLAMGQSVSGTISSDDPRLAGGHNYDVYAFSGTAGEMVSVGLSSPSFDTYLVLSRNDGVITEEVATNDDGGEGTDSRITHTLPTSGSYLVVVRGLMADATGRYTLQLDRIVEGETTVRTIAPGESRVGELDSQDAFTSDFAHYEIFTFAGRAGERVSVSMRSEHFDTYLAVGGWDGQSLAVLETNDDGFSDGTDSRLTLALPRDGTYGIRATSLSGQRTGPFVVSLESLGATREVAAVSIRSGETLIGELSVRDGQLGDGSFYDLYSYTGRAGERVTVTVRSDDFDTWLSVGTPEGAGGFTELEFDDDGAGGTDSRVTLTVPSGGRLLIRANSLIEGATGRYSIAVQGGS